MQLNTLKPELRFKRWFGKGDEVEIIGGEDVTERYALTMVITEKMTKQPIWKHERRNKLLRYAAVHS